MNATKRAQVPFGLRKKLMAATSMLLVAAIMLVSTSYAWFTLSTAPEITGITTSVGANGNLEIALLDTETFNAPDQITSNSGDSMENTNDGHTVQEANITWGNLIDLSNGYGLNMVTLYPSKLSAETTDNKTTISNLSPLMIPQYGYDGRVSAVARNETFTAIYDSDKKLFAEGDEMGYGVRAVGTSSKMSARELILRNAQGMYNSKAGAVTSPIVSAVTKQSNMSAFLTLATATSAPTSYTYDQVRAMGEIATGVQTAVNNVVAAYLNAAIAKVAADENIEEAKVTALYDLISNQTDAGEIARLLQSATNDAATDTTYVIELTALDALQDKVQKVVETVNTLKDNNTNKADYTTTSGFYANDQTSNDITVITDDVFEVLLGVGMPIADANGDPIAKKDALAAGEFYLTGGVVASETEGIVKYSGKFFITDGAGLCSVYAGKATEAGTLSVLGPQVAAFEYEKDDNNTDEPVSITDMYGYIIDFAFRTNAAESFLQLQTEGINRVYKDAQGTDLATQGAGSTLSFVYSGVNATQAKNLLEAVRVVFFNPDTGEVYKTARVGNVTNSAAENTSVGQLYLVQSESTAYTLGKDAYQVKTGATTYELKDKMGEYETSSGTYFSNATTVAASYTAEEWADAIADGGALATEKTVLPVVGDGGAVTTIGALGQDAYEEVTTYEINTNFKYNNSTELTSSNCTNYINNIPESAYNTLKSKTFETTAASLDGEGGDITKLDQNSVLKMSALVYLDGENIDNSAVANAANSGTMKLNLQFSSSATLTPMKNSDLENMVKPTPTP